MDAVVAKLGLAAVLNKLLDLNGEPAKLVLVLLVQIALELWRKNNTCSLGIIK